MQYTQAAAFTSSIFRNACLVKLFLNAIHLFVKYLKRAQHTCVGCCFFFKSKPVMDNQKAMRLGCGLNPSCSIQQLSKTITRALHSPTFFPSFISPE